MNDQDGLEISRASELKASRSLKKEQRDCIRRKQRNPPYLSRLREVLTSDKGKDTLETLKDAIEILILKARDTKRI